jgi:hypothetical protein
LNDVLFGFVKESFCWMRLLAQDPFTGTSYRAVNLSHDAVVPKEKNGLFLAEYLIEI